MKENFNFKTLLVIMFQVIGATVGFIASLIVVNNLIPVSKEMIAAIPKSGVLSMPVAMLFVGLVNGTILIWAGRRSKYKKFSLWMQLLVLSFGLQVFMTQIETGYFLSAFPLLQGNFELYSIILRGFITSFLFTFLVALLVGGFSNKIRPAEKFLITSDETVKTGSWLPVVYIVLYMVFGYFVAWQSQELRLFYGGPKVLNSFVSQWSHTLMIHPEFMVFQYFRGVLWLLCLIPLFKGFTGNRLEIIILSALAMGLLPTVQLAFANPLMPATISIYHFVETSISTGIYGAICATVIPKNKKLKEI